MDAPSWTPALASNARSTVEALAVGAVLSGVLAVSADAGGIAALPVTVLTTETAAVLFAVVVAVPVARGDGVLAGYALAFGAGIAFSLSTGYPYAFGTPSLAKLAPVAVAVGLAFAAVFGTAGTVLATCWRWLRHGR